MALCFHRLTFVIFVLLLLKSIVCEPAFFSFYDLAVDNSNQGSHDLIGSGPVMQGGQATTNGIYLPQGTDWVDSNNDPLYVEATEELASATIISAFSSPSCKEGEFLMWAVTDKKNKEIKCGIYCLRSNLTWCLACQKNLGSSGTNVKLECSESFTTTANVATIMGLSFSDENEMVAITAYAQEGSSGIKNFSNTFKGISNKTLFNKAQIAYNANAGYLYYVGPMNETINQTAFSQYAGSGDVATKSIVCSNCQSVTSSPTCNYGKLNVVSNKIREYYCACPYGYGNDTSSQSCEKVGLTNCNESCKYGCEVNNGSRCFQECLYPYTVQELYGDFVVCSEQGGEANGTTKNHSKSSSDRKIWYWVMVVGVPVFSGVILIILFICLYKKYCATRELVYSDSTKNNGEKPDKAGKTEGQCLMCGKQGEKLVRVSQMGETTVCEACMKQITENPFDRLPGWLPVNELTPGNDDPGTIPEKMQAAPAIIVQSSVVVAKKNYSQDDNSIEVLAPSNNKAYIEKHGSAFDTK